MLPDEIIDRIAPVEVVSFDIFDTAIFRKVLKPSDVFSLTQKRYESEFGCLNLDFTKCRIEAEGLVRSRVWQNEKRTEVSLEEIYQAIYSEHIHNWDIINKVKKMELSIEGAVCSRNYVIFEVYKMCLLTKKRIIFLSDIYLPEDTVRKILFDNGYANFEKLFVSSKVSLTKSSGEIYPYVLKELRIAPHQMLHIGDNYVSDIVNAKKYQIGGFHYLKEKPNTEPFRNFGRTDLSHRSHSIHTALVNNIRNSIFSVGNNFWFEIGYEELGILVSSFVLWLVQELRRNKIEKVFFFARDGFLLKQVYDILSCNDDELPKSEYLFVSRRSLNFPAIDILGEDQMNFLMSGTGKMRVQDYLWRIGIDPSRIDDLINKCGFKSTQEYVNSPSQYAKLRNLFYLLKETILDLTAEERRLVGLYFKQVGINNYKRIAIVDLGWHGTLQMSFQELLKDMQFQVEVSGFYMGTFKKAKAFEKNLKFNSYLFHFGHPQKNHDTLRLSVPFFEFVHSATHGTVINYKEENGKIIPQFAEEECGPTYKRHLNQLHEGVLTYVKDMLPLKDFFNYTPEQALYPIGKLLRKPSLSQIEYIGNIEHVDGFGGAGSRQKLVAPMSLFSAILKPQEFLKAYIRSYWRAGFLRRILSLKKEIRK